MDIKDIRYLKILTELESFSKAAKILYISQPALSQSIKRLEADLGFPLFYRDRTQVHATELCLQIVQKATPILVAFDQLNEEIRHYEQPINNNILLGISQFYGHHVLSTVLKYFKEHNKEQKLDIIEGESHFIENQIKEGKIDFGIFPTPIYSKFLRTHRIVQEEILLAINTKNEEAIKLASSLCNSNSNKEVPLKDFAKFPFILLKPGLKLRTLAMSICKDNHFQPTAIFETENLDTCQSLVANNYGIAFLPNTIRYNKLSPDIQFFHIQSEKKYRDLVITATPSTSDKLDLNKMAKLLGKDLQSKKDDS